MPLSLDAQAERREPRFGIIEPIIVERLGSPGEHLRRIGEVQPAFPQQLGPVPEESRMIMLARAMRFHPAAKKNSQRFGGRARQGGQQTANQNG